MNNIEDKIKNGYQLDLPKLYQETLQIYKKSVLVSGLILFLVAIIVFMIYAIGLFSYFETPFPTEQQIEQFNINHLSNRQLIQIGFFQALIFGFFGVVSAGLLRLCESVDKQQLPTLEIVFKVFTQKQGIQVFFFAFIFQVLLSAITFVFDSLSVFLVSWFIMILAYTLFILVIPLIVFEKYSIRKAISSSIKLVNQRPFMLLSLVMFHSVFAVAGIFFLLIGVFATFPVWYAFIYSLYKQLS